MSDISFSWFCPSHGPGGNGPSDILNAEQIIKSAIIAENAGFDAILTPADSNCLDPWSVASYMIHATKKIKPIIALRTGFIEPVYAARMSATLNHLSDGRVELNIVSGGSPVELAKEGCFLNHPERYKRTYEYMDIMTNLFKTCGPYSFNGEYYKTKNSTLHPPNKNQSPKIYVAGASEEAKNVAYDFDSTYLLWAEPLESVANHISYFDKIPREKKAMQYGLRVNIIVRKNRTEAIEIAESFLKKNTASQRLLQLITKSSDSVGQKRMSANAIDNKIYDNCLWSSFISGKTGSVPTLVGSTQDILDSLKRYNELGIDNFIFASINHDKEARFVGEEILGKLG